MAAVFEEEEVHITGEDFANNAKEEKKRRRAEKKRRRHYKFSNKKHSKRGIASSFIALGALALIVCAVLISVRAEGAGGEIVGGLCALSLFVALAGIISGLLAFRQTDVFYRFAWIGIFANGIIWLFDATMIVMGL